MSRRSVPEPLTTARLFLAAKRGDVEAVDQVLTRRRESVDLRDYNPYSRRDSGRTPLSHAARNGHIDMVRLLIQKYNAMVDVKDQYGWTPLMLAVGSGNTDIVQALAVDFEANIETREPVSGMTPIMIAAALGHVEVFNLLRKLGANELVKDWHGKSLLEIAIEERHFNIISQMKRIPTLLLRHHSW